MLIQDECSLLLNQYEDLNAELAQLRANEKMLRKKLYENEFRLSQMRLYIDDFRMSINDQETELSLPVQPGLRKLNKGMKSIVP